MGQGQKPFTITDENGVNWPACRMCRVILTVKNSIFVANGLGSYCKKCNSDRSVWNYRRRRFGLTPKQYNEILEKQGGVCAICNRKNNNGTTLSVDHDHVTGEIRELLCNNCNVTIGNCEENIDILMKIINYLIKHKNLEKEFQFEGMDDEVIP